jgi:acyl-CoA synthetase (AMP-forming)/AMP-acid ligase II
LTEHEITVLQATPATWRMLTLADWRSPTTRAFCGGEPLPADLARDLLGRVPSLWNLYGPTEATVWSTTEQVVDASDITIGRPIDNTTIRLLDAYGNRVPIGTPGRLFIGGDGVASGYHRRRALTAQRFIEDPFAGEESARLYDTGDWAYWRADGRLAFASRDDDQVKVRGFRIELGDVEAAIGAVAGVKAAAVAVWSPSAGDTRLVAYVVVDPSSPLDQVRDALRERLPEYMVPSLWIARDALPMTPNLKLDRRRLPPPQPVALGQSARALSSARERWLARIWMDALGTGSLGPQSNFFDCGGHSLLAMQVLHRIETETGVRINPLELSLQTLAQLAARIDEGAARTPEAS